MNCPLCTDQNLNPNYHSGIEIDVCPKCNGIWLDRGEIGKLVASSLSAPSPPPQHISAAGFTDDVQDTVRGERPDRRPKKDRDSDSRRYEEKRQKSKKSKQSKKQKSKAGRLADRLEDILEDVLDL